MDGIGLHLQSKTAYPFQEGDTYYTLESINQAEIRLLIKNGENPYVFDVVESVWDEISEELHDENPNRKYFSTREEAEENNISYIEYVETYLPF
jgi:hypothetical protein